MFNIDKFQEDAHSGECIDKEAFLQFIESFQHVILWGAGNLGTAVGNKLKQMNLPVSAYWDTRAKDIVELNGITVLNPFEGSYEPDNTLVALCISDVSISARIEDQVRDHGYTNILMGAEIYQGLICPFNKSTAVDMNLCRNSTACIVYTCRRLYNIIHFRYKLIEQSLYKKGKLKVAFFVIQDSVWKYDRIYKLMEQDSRFDPIVVICPEVLHRDGLNEILHGDELMFEGMHTTFRTFSEKGYKVIETYDQANRQWRPIKEELNPDIVFFTYPHEVTRDEYSISNFANCLTCYAPYGVTHTHLHGMQYNMLIHNVLWKFFVETELHKSMSEHYAFTRGINTIITGYPGIDAFIDRNYKPNNVWKINDRSRKRIIWAPHHSLEEEKTYLSYSNFGSLYEAMLDTAKEYKDKIQIAFKPHPLLKPKLYLEPDWGKEKTDSYYEKWRNLTNGQLNESDYVDLFLTSDAMILDSGSFLNEYLCVNKPSLYIVRDANLTDRFNTFGKMAFSCHYHGSSIDEIKYFIEHNVIGGNDEIKPAREMFVKTYLIPPNNVSASENIYNYIKTQLSLS